MNVAVASSQHSPMLAARLLTDGVEVPLAHALLEAHVVRPAGRAHLEPRRLAPLVEALGLDDREGARHTQSFFPLKPYHYATAKRAPAGGSGRSGGDGAEGGTRTPTGCPTRPSNVRVCQF